MNSLNANILGHSFTGGQASVTISWKKGMSDMMSSNNKNADFGRCSRLIALSVTCLIITALVLGFVIDFGEKNNHTSF